MLDKNFMSTFSTNGSRGKEKVCKTMSFAHRNQPKGASLDYQCRFYQPFGSYLEPVTRTSESVGPGAYETNAPYKAKACAAKMVKPSGVRDLGNGEECYDMIDNSRVF